MRACGTVRSCARARAGDETYIGWERETERREVRRPARAAPCPAVALPEIRAAYPLAAGRAAFRASYLAWEGIRASAWEAYRDGPSAASLRSQESAKRRFHQQKKKNAKKKKRQEAHLERHKAGPWEACPVRETALAVRREASQQPSDARQQR